MEISLKNGDFWLSAVLENISEGVVGVDSTGAIAWMNPAAERLTDRREQQAKDQPVETVFTLPAGDVISPIGISVQSVLNGGDMVREKNRKLILSSNRSIPVDYTIAPVFSGGDRKGAVIIFAAHIPGFDADRRSEDGMEKSARGPTRSQRVLVMDDDDVIRKLTTQKLKRLGYESEGAENGDDAVAQYRTARDSGNPFDIVVLDLVVHGGMGGKDTIEALRGIDPDVKAVLATGHAADPVLTSFWEYGFMGVVRKPFVIKELDLAIRQALEKE